MKRFLGFVCTLLCVLCMITGADYTYEAHALTEEEAAWVDEARGVLKEIVEEREIMALVYLEDAYQVRRAADETSAAVATVYSGHTVYIEDVTIDDNYVAWAYVRFYSGGQEMQGYVDRGHLACSDERFLQWESDYGMNPGAAAMYSVEGITADGESVSGGDQMRYTNGIDQFPESYQQALRALVETYPEAANWTFVKQVANLDWSTVITNELQKDRSWVPASWAACMREGATKDSGWHYASRDILEYYMDPRNGLTMDGIFQFEQLTYNESCHTYEALQTFLDTTFMNGSKPAPGMDTMTYADIFHAIGKDSIRLVSPFHLAVRVLQEQGQGTSDLISGRYPGYENLYNYFNVGATGADGEIVKNGLTYAANGRIRVLNEETGKVEWVSQPWNNAYFAILGGADVVTANYIQKGQDTIYLQKFNVGPDSQYAHYTHQYMQNIAAPTSEGKNTRKFYASAEALAYPFVFKIPVFENMPETACEKPTASTSVVLKVPAGYDGTTVYLDNQAYTPETRNGQHIVTAADGGTGTAVVFKYNEKGTPIGMYIWTLEYKDGAYTVTAQPDLADLLSYHGFSIRITGKSGIRFKTGISVDMRARLTGDGVNGFKLKEYGGLIMNDAARAQYPFIRGGQKVQSGVAFGTNPDGTRKDVIFETVDGRHRFTSVFVGLPAGVYKTNYAFCSYIVLEKEGVETTIYGPVLTRSIYNLAEQLLASGNYAAGSAVDTFLRQLISDGDAASAQASTVD